MSTDLPRAPRYGSASIADVLASAAASIGASGQPNALNLPASTGTCLVLVDGLGAQLLKSSLAHAPFLRSALQGSLPGADYRTIDAAFPTTTASSLTSLGTGVAPGQHGMVGYDVLDPDQRTRTADGELPGKVVNLLGRWDAGVDPVRWQSCPTVFEQVSGQIPVATVSSPQFEHSAMTVAALRGSVFHPVKKPGDRVAEAARIFAQEPASLVYLYWAELDKAGHKYGAHSPEWEAELADLDLAMKQLHSVLPQGVNIVLSADHGMVDVPLAGRIDFSTEPELLAGVQHTAGEPRLVQLYLEPDAELEHLRQSWLSHWGHAAWVLTRQEAMDAGMFGTVRAEVSRRTGDLLVAAREPVAFFDVGRTGDRPLSMVGHHGSLTAAERLVPLLTIRRGRKTRG